MRITVKVLKGEECEVEVSESTTVLELKAKVEQALPHIPVAYQKLLCVGRTLVDDKSLGSYAPALKPGCKLTLVVKEPETLREAMQKLFKRFYAEDQSEELTKALLVELEKRIGQLSLDDVERLATHFLEQRNTATGQQAKPSEAVVVTQ